MANVTTISIVIPCYNQTQYLRDCLRSLLAQTLEHWEAIVVDDASTQGDPEEIIKALGDERIKLFRHLRNLGQGAARNTGFKNAQGEIVLPLDADDMLVQTYLRKVSSVLLEDPNVDCAFCDLQLFGARNEIWHYAVFDAMTMTQRQWIPGAGAMMRRNLWQRLGGYCESPEIIANEDWDFWLAAMDLGIQVVHVPEALYLYRRHPGSTEFWRPYHAFSHREFIYRRHRLLFDRYGTGRDFLANGYYQSASAYWQRGARWRAVWLAFHGFLMAPERRYFAKMILRTLCPEPLISVASRIRNRKVR